MSENYRAVSDIPEDLQLDLRFHCPVSDCEHETSVDQLESFSCPECGAGFVLKVIDDVLIPTVRRNGVSGYLTVVEMPELPRERRNRFISEHDLNAEQASKLITSMDVADFYEDLSDEVSDQTAGSFIADTLLGELHYRDMSIDEIESEDTVAIVQAIENDQITRKSAVNVVREALDGRQSIDEVYESKDIEKIGSEDLQSIVEQVIETEQDAVQDYRDGDDGAINYLVGQVMSETEGQADAEEARKSLESEIQNNS